jgi:hypothetical protein
MEIAAVATRLTIKICRRSIDVGGLIGKHISRNF